jgi:hypothetical protein
MHIFQRMSTFLYMYIIFAIQCKHYHKSNHWDFLFLPQHVCLYSCSKYSFHHLDTIFTNIHPISLKLLWIFLTKSTLLLHFSKITLYCLLNHHKFVNKFYFQSYLLLHDILYICFHRKFVIERVDCYFNS